MLDLTAAYTKAFAPRDRREIDAWAREHVKVGAWSPWEGDFTTDRTPWIVEPMRILGRPGPRKLTILGPAAGGKSTIGEVFLAWVIDNAPGFTVWYAQDEEAAKEFAETRVQRFLASCERVSRWFPSGANRNSKRTQAIHFPHMSFVIQAANQGNAQSKHIRHLIKDEPWMYKPGMSAQLDKRTTRFAHNKTILEMSTGSLEGDEVDQSWNQGTRQRWQFRCMKCEQVHVPRFRFDRADAPGGVKWSAKAKRADGTWDVRAVTESAVYECPMCRARYDTTASNGYALNRDGTYTEAAADAMPNHWSFHWNCIASDFSQLGSIAVEFINANQAIKRGTTVLMQEFVQKKEAEAWKERPPEIQASNIESDYNMGDAWADESIRIMIVDCQKSHFWGLIRSFSKDGRSRLVACKRIAGWHEIKEFQELHAVPDFCVYMDSGHQADAVYTACCLYGWFSIKGENAPGGYLMPNPTGTAKIRVIARESADLNGRAVEYYPAQLTKGSRQGCCFLYLVSDDMSSEVLSRARSGLLTGWTIARDTPEFYRAQLASMVLKSKPNPKTNKPEYFYKEIGKAGNHLWDCERYAIAAAFLLDHFHFTESEKTEETQK